MPKNYPRADRVEKLALEVIGEAVQQLKDPRIGFVTVTGVKLSGDLRMARVFVSALGSREERDDSIAAVKHASAHLRSVFGKEVRMRHLPQLEILEDQTAEVGNRIEMLLSLQPPARDADWQESQGDGQGAAEDPPHQSP